jgi:signal transduction histidine kinase
VDAQILLVEDNKLSTTITTAALEAAGYSVRAEVDGRAALEALDEQSFDLVISDWVMPGMDGLGLLKQIRQHGVHSRLYVIFLTSNDSREQMIEALTAGADDFVAKPFDPEELLARVRAALRVVTLQRALQERAERDALLLAQERKLTATLRELDRQKDELVSIVTHELLSPLTSVQGYVEILLEGAGGELTEEQARLLGVVDRNARRLKRTIDDLLFLSRAEAGQLSYDHAPLDLRRLLDEQLDVFTLRATAQGIALNAELSDARLVGDELRLSQLIENLLSNAIKFTPEGGEVSVSLAADPCGIALSVSDTGIGIPVAEQHSLFGRFYRASSARDHAIPGTGLGLAISKAIVDAHGGTISCASLPGRGTTFAVALPVTAA